MMSQKRMQELLIEFQNRHWNLENNHEMFEVENEEIYWTLKRGEVSLQLEFPILGDLGQPSDDLKDIAYCESQNHINRLFFGEKNPAIWKKKIQTFIFDLESAVKSQNSSE